MIDENLVRKILLEMWDPFCVGDNPNLADEYDGFIGIIIDDLQQNHSQMHIENCLEKIETELRAPVTPAARRKTALALIKLGN